MAQSYDLPFHSKSPSAQTSQAGNSSMAMSQSYNLPSRPESTSARSSQSSGRPSRGRSMSPDTGKSDDRRYHSRSPLRAMSPSHGRSSSPGRKGESSPAYFQNSRQDMESPWTSLNESISEPATEHEMVDPPFTAASPTNASFSPTPSEPAPLSDEEHLQLAYENLLQENLRRKEINDRAMEEIQAKLDETSHMYVTLQAELRCLTRLPNLRGDHERQFRTRKSFICYQKFAARRARMEVRFARAEKRHNIAFTRWRAAASAANAADDALNNTRADIDTAWNFLMGTDSGAGSPMDEIRGSLHFPWG